MKKTFYKNLFRDIKKSLSRFLSIVIIIAVGVAFYSGVRATSPDMKMSGDYYLSKNNFMDFKLISTMGLTMEDLSEIKKQSGILKVEGSYSLDAVIEKNKHSFVLNVNSLPPENGINTIKILKGRTAKKSNEAVVEERFLRANKLKIGDEIILQSGKTTNIEKDLKNNRFKIVGSAQSPLYLSAQRQLSSVGNGSVKGFVYVLPEVFKTDVFTEIYLKINSEKSKTSLINNEDYKNIAEGIENNIKKLADTRVKVRYDEVLSSAQTKITEAETKLNNSKQEAADKFSDGYKQLDEAQRKITKGVEKLKQNQILFDNKIAKGQKQILDGSKLLDESENKLNLGKLQAANNISASIKEKLEAAKKQLDSDPQNQSYINQYNFLNLLYKNDIIGKDFDAMYNSLEIHGTLDQVKSFFDIDTLKSDFDNAASEIQINREKIAASVVELNKSKEEGMSKLKLGKEELEKGQRQLDENTEKLKAEEIKANLQIKDGELEIQKNRDKLNDIKEPTWYVLGRSANVGYESYRQDSDRIGNIGKTFPFIFFLVAALVSLTTMTRMVQENRIEIGTFKALGYSRTAIVSHYLMYSLAASLTGSLIGISFAFKLFPPLIMKAYDSLYAIPSTVAPFDTKLAIQASLLAVLFTTVAAVAATLEELREVPASLMRPKPPKSGKIILLEKVTFIWKRLSFTKKVTARNIFRYKQRFFMTVIGIAACTGLMIIGFGIKWGIVGANTNQFNKIYKYDMQATLNKNIDIDNESDVKKSVMGDTNVSSVLFAYSKNATVKLKNKVNQDTYLIIPEDKDALNSYINLTMDGRELRLDDNGVIVTQKLSKMINKKSGDIVEITLNEKIVKARISAVTEHYLQHFIYMSANYYQEISGNNLKVNAFYGLLKNTSDEAQNNTAKTIKSIDNIAAVSFKNNIQVDYNNTMKSINSVVLILIISAGVLAFVVIYNLTNININERRRELATIKLLGFYNNELAGYIYRENVILTVIGSIVGIYVGIVLNNFVLNAAETNVIMFLKTIDPIYFLYSVLLTITFSVIVNLAMYGQFEKIDMIESLKNAE